MFSGLEQDNFFLENSMGLPDNTIENNSYFTKNSMQLLSPHLSCNLKNAFIILYFVHLIIMFSYILENNQKDYHFN